MLHNDLPWNLRAFLHGQLLEFNFDSNLRSTPPWSKSAWSQTDLPRLRRGLVGAQLWVAYVPCKAQHVNAVQITLEQIDLIRRLIAKYPANLTLALSADDIEKAHKEGKIAGVIAVEGGHSIGNSLATLRSFYELGVRCLTLTHTCNTPWADSAQVGRKPEHGVLLHMLCLEKLNLMGQLAILLTVVLEMNRLGMLVDLSHTSQLTMKDALKVSKAPVIFSHSSAYALCNSSRNVPDDILKELVWNRGIIMVTFYNIYVKCDMKGPVTVRDVADHINYIRGKIGIQHIGIGSDFDGINMTPVGLEDVSKFPKLFVELARNPNWSNEELKMVAGKNFLRVFREVENVRDAMRSTGVPVSFEQIPPRDLKSDAIRCRFNTTTTSSSSIH
ncbi:Dipeptidase 1 [Orchesella cincta]|uniref:Dipeptidase n=1 Tax=Orchesella cincta TaxID=48709 RepID=A0A1D2MZ83_ORCCI|nr:Dipeptidase 1 [Orchesella cincta]